MFCKQVTFARAPDHYQQRWLGMLTPTQIDALAEQRGSTPSPVPSGASVSTGAEKSGRSKSQSQRASDPVAASVSPAVKRGRFSHAAVSRDLLAGARPGNSKRAEAAPDPPWGGGWEGSGVLSQPRFPFPGRHPRKSKSRFSSTQPPASSHRLP